VDGILHEKAKDQSYSHSKIIRLCIDEQLSVPVSLFAGLLEAEIENFKQEKKSILISGFPKDREQLDEFERKVRIDFSPDHLKHASSYNQIDPKIKQCYFLADLNKDIANVETELKTWKAPVKDFEADLERSAAYFEKVGRHFTKSGAST
jgi:adenylate kinase family enzyme